MGNRLTTGASVGTEEPMYFDESASVSLGEDLSDSSLDILAPQNYNSTSSGASDVLSSATRDTTTPAVSDDGGLSNLAFAPSLKDISARTVLTTTVLASEPLQAAGQQPHSDADRRTRICPIVQNGRQVTKDFYWLLPERRKPSIGSRTLPAVADEDEYQNVISGSSSTPKPPPRRICRSESSGPAVTGGAAHRRASAVRLCRRTASSASDSAGCTFAAFAPHQWRHSLVLEVQSAVPGVTDDECRLALGLNRGNSELAAKYLKVEQLFRLGLAERSDCLAVLQASDWCLETAAVALADRAACTD